MNEKQIYNEIFKLSNKRQKTLLKIWEAENPHQKVHYADGSRCYDLAKQIIYKRIERDNNVK